MVVKSHIRAMRGSRDRKRNTCRVALRFLKRPKGDCLWLVEPNYFNTGGTLLLCLSNGLMLCRVALNADH